MSDYKKQQRLLKQLAKRPLLIEKAKDAHASGLNREQRRKIRKGAKK